jgi:hypothetical protein
LGLVTVTTGSVIIPKTESLVSKGMLSVESLTFIRHWEEIRTGTVQGKLPVFAVPEVIVIQVLPLLVDSSILAVG